MDKDKNNRNQVFLKIGLLPFVTNGNKSVMDKSLSILVK